MARFPVPLSEAQRMIPTPAGMRFATVFQHGTLQVEIFAPRGQDTQSPHTRDEVYVVVRGECRFVCVGEHVRFGQGDFLFAPAGAVHRFEEFSDDLVVGPVLRSRRRRSRRVIGLGIRLRDRPLNRRAARAGGHYASRDGRG